MNKKQLNEEIEKALNFHNSHNIMTSQPKGVMAVSETRKLLEKAISLSRQQAFKDVEKVIDKMPFIMCIKDAEGNDKVSKSWREQFVIRREELKEELEKVK